MRESTLPQNLFQISTELWIYATIGGIVVSHRCKDSHTAIRTPTESQKEANLRRSEGQVFVFPRGERFHSTKPIYANLFLGDMDRNN